MQGINSGANALAMCNQDMERKFLSLKGRLPEWMMCLRWLSRGCSKPWRNHYSCLCHKQEQGLRRLDIGQDTSEEAIFRMTKLIANFCFPLLLKISANDTIPRYSFLKPPSRNFWHNGDPGKFLRQENFVQYLSAVYQFVKKCWACVV